MFMPVRMPVHVLVCLMLAGFGVVLMGMRMLMLMLMLVLTFRVAWQVPVRVLWQLLFILFRVPVFDMRMIVMHQYHHELFQICSQSSSFSLLAINFPMRNTIPTQRMMPTSAESTYPMVASSPGIP
jgi:hypothetical protein